MYNVYVFLIQIYNIFHQIWPKLHPQALSFNLYVVETCSQVYPTSFIPASGTTQVSMTQIALESTPLLCLKFIVIIF